MIRSRGVLLPIALALLAAGCGGGEEQEQESSANRAALPPDFSDMTPTVVVETTEGDIVMELDRAKAPETVRQFLLHVDANFYDGLTFHRVIPGFMIQGGGFTSELRERQSSASELENEADNGLANLRGTVAMARRNDPHSAKNQFFINLTDNPQLDHTDKTMQGWGYTVFGRVIEGMDVVDSIAQVETRTVGRFENVPVDPVVIERAYVKTETSAE